jgi:protein kinase|tara:strand:- start:1626 stop:1820 length:195 start_codon:yes stop_codon:yes gene_type:complete
MDQIDKIFQILGTPKKDQWREGYRLAEKREIVFNEYPKRNLQKYLPGVGELALQSIKYMLKISG